MLSIVYFRKVFFVCLMFLVMYFPQDILAQNVSDCEYEECIHYSSDDISLTVEVPDQYRNAHLINLQIYSHEDFYSLDFESRDPFLSYFHETTYLQVHLKSLLGKGRYVARVRIVDRKDTFETIVEFER